MAIQIKSLKDAGFASPREAIQGKRKFRRLMIGTEGLTDTGKTEFGLSCPGPGALIALDRNFDAVFDNPNPPAARGSNWVIKTISAKLFTQSRNAADFKPYWDEFYNSLLSALDDESLRTVMFDDSDSWELQRMAVFGTLTKVSGPPGLAYTEVNAAKRALTARLWDSGKIIVGTNKLTAEYKNVYNADGTPQMEGGREVKQRTGEFERRGFSDTDYLWQVQLRHLFKPAETVVKFGRTIQRPPQWGIKILKAKGNPSKMGEELWGDDCNFLGLVSTIYPQVPIADWGL